MEMLRMCGKQKPFECSDVGISFSFLKTEKHTTVLFWIGFAACFYFSDRRYEDPDCELREVVGVALNVVRRLFVNFLKITQFFVKILPAYYFLFLLCLLDQY